MKSVRGVCRVIILTAAWFVFGNATSKETKFSGFVGKIRKRSFSKHMVLKTAAKKYYVILDLSDDILLYLMLSMFISHKPSYNQS